MNMKRIVLSALLLAVVTTLAVSAITYHEPTAGADYRCDYVNPPAPSADPGLSTFSITRSIDPSGLPIWRGIEYFDATWGGTDNRKVTFAKPVNHGATFTRWEFTINPSGPQCTQTDVYNYGKWIYFQGCSDGHSRSCERLY